MIEDSEDSKFCSPPFYSGKDYSQKENIQDSCESSQEKIHPSIIHVRLVLCRVAGICWSLSQLSWGKRKGYTLDSLSVHHRAPGEDVQANSPWGQTTHCSEKDYFSSLSDYYKPKQQDFLNNMFCTDETKASMFGRTLMHPFYEKTNKQKKTPIRAGKLIWS